MTKQTKKLNIGKYHKDLTGQAVIDWIHAEELEDKMPTIMLNVEISKNLGFIVKRWAFIKGNNWLELDNKRKELGL